MVEARLDQVMARIETALMRIENASAQTAASDDGVDTDLRERHNAFRRQVAASLASLDALIGSLER